MNPRLLWLVLLLSCAALGSWWLLSLRSGEDPSPGSVDAEQAARESSRAEGSPEVQAADEKPSDPPDRILILEFESRDNTGSGAPARDDARTSGGEVRTQEVFPPLPEGRGGIRIAVRDGAGSLVEGATVELRSIEAAGGAERIVTGRDGEARYPDLAAGRYAYRVWASRGTEVASADSLRLEEGEWKKLTVRLTELGLALTGRVLDRRGEPVAGIEVSATRHRFASAVSESVSGDRSPRATRSRDDGSFEIRGLAEGEYDVETPATDRFAPAKALVQAGGAPLDLVLSEGVRVYGTVTNERSEALERVYVAVQGGTSVFTYTDDRGGFELHLKRESENRDIAHALRFNLQGYREKRMPIPDSVLEGDRALRLDVELQTVEDAALVSGSVVSERGEPVAGATVVLSMGKGQRYQAASGVDGLFSLSDVEIGRNYELRVLAPVPYRDHLDQGIRVSEGGLSLEIVLESLETGRLVGRMVDVEGEPLPGLRLWLASSAAVRSSVPVSGDERGYFELAEAPAGTISFDTRAEPRLRVSGLTLRSGGDADVLLVLDAGEEQMTGEILDDRGDPVAGAQVTLSWSRASGALQSTSLRSTRTDPDGSFRFIGLGPGEHLLEVRAAGFRPVQEYRDVGRYAEEVELRLEASDS
jgi:hypothetical protein